MAEFDASEIDFSGAKLIDATEIDFSGATTVEAETPVLDQGPVSREQAASFFGGEFPTEQDKSVSRTRQSAIDRFLQKNLSGTDPSILNQGLLDNLRNKLAVSKGSERQRVNNQIKAVEGFLNLKNAPIENGRIAVTNPLAKKALGIQEQAAILESKGDVSLGETLFPELQEALIGVKDNDLTTREVFAVIQDITTLPGRAIQSIIEELGDSADIGDFKQRMARRGVENTTTGEIIKGVTDVLNFVPSAKLAGGGGVGKLLEKAATETAKIAEKAPRAIRATALKAAENIPEAFNFLAAKLGKGAEKVEQFAFGRADDVAESLARTDLPSNIARGLEALPLEGADKLKFVRSMARTAIEDLPFTIKDAMFRLTNGVEDDAQILLDAFIGSTIGGFLGRNKLKSDRITDRLENLRNIEGAQSEEALKEIGVDIRGLQVDNVKKALEILSEEAGAKSKDIDILGKGFNVDLTDVTGELDRLAEQTGNLRFAPEKVAEISENIKARGESSTQITFKEARDELDVLIDNTSFKKDDVSEVKKSARSYNEAWKSLKNQLTKDMPEETASKVKSLFEEITSLNQDIISPIGKGKTGLKLDAKIESVIKKLRRAVSDPKVPVESALRPVFLLADQAKKITTKKFQNLIDETDSVGKKNALRKQMENDIKRFSFGGNELRNLALNVQEFGEKEGLSKFLEGTKSGRVAKIWNMLVGASKAPVKGAAKGARRNATETAQFLIDLIGEDSGEQLGDITKTPVQNDEGFIDGVTRFAKDTINKEVNKIANSIPKEKVMKAVLDAGMRIKSGDKGADISQASTDLLPMIKTVGSELKKLGVSKAVITSLFRSKSKNKTVGGVEDSKHPEGKAFDIRTRGISKDSIEKIKALNIPGVDIVFEGDHFHFELK